MKKIILTLSAIGGISLSILSAETVVWEEMLRSQGLDQPVRVSGYSRSTDLYFALPVRTPGLQDSSVRLILRTSPSLARGSRITFALQDQPVAETPLSPEQQLILDIPLTRLSRPWQPADYLKLTLHTELRDGSARSRCQQWDDPALWVEVDPGTTFRTTFDNQSADWQAVARLPITLRPGTTIRAERSHLDMLLKLESWLSFLRPLDRVTNPGPDRVDVVAPQPGQLPVRVTVNGPQRTIQVAADSTAWSTLRALSRPVELRAPGNALSIHPPAGQLLSPLNQAALTRMDPDFGQEMRGINILQKNLSFDRALFGADAGVLELELSLRHTPVQRPEAGYAALIVNGHLVEAAPLQPGHSSLKMNARLKSPVLSENNSIALVVVFVPTEEQCSNPSFFFRCQVAPESYLRVVSRQAPNRISSVTAVAQRDFTRVPYEVLLPDRPSEDVIQAARAWVRWLQRVHGHSLMEPILGRLDQKSSPHPALVLDPDGSSAGALKGLDEAVLRRDGEAWLLEDARRREYSLHLDQPVAFLQAIPSRPGQPALLWASATGPDAATLISRMASAMESQPWAGPGNVLLFNGISPLDAMDTSNLDPGSRLIAAEQTSSSWRVWRWVLLVPLWGLITWLAFWILKPRE